MRFGVYELFREYNEWNFLHIDYEAEVQAFKDENDSIPQPVRHGFVTNKSPLCREPAILVVLQGGTRAEVSFKESLKGKEKH